VQPPIRITLLAALSVCIAAGVSPKRCRSRRSTKGCAATESRFRGNEAGEVRRRSHRRAEQHRASQNLILIRVDAPQVQRAGVIAGMSGSPIYIDGKVIGALAYAWQFAKEPVAA